MKNPWKASAALSIYIVACMLGGVVIGHYTAGTSDDSAEVVTGDSSDFVESPSAEAPSSNETPKSTEKLLEATDDALQDILEGIPKGEAPSGSGMITGTILTEDGRPLAGAQVYLFAQKSGGRAWKRFSNPGDAGDLVSSFCELLETERRRLDQQKRATSDEYGQFAFEGLSETTFYTIRAYLEGWEIIDRRIRGHHSRPFNWRESTQHGRLKRDVRPGEPVHFLAEPRVRVPIDVILPDGSVPEVAKIYYRPAGRGGTRHRFGHWYPERPYLVLEPGAWEISARVGEDNEFTSSFQTIVLHADLAADLVSIEVESRTAVSGRVFFAPGEAQTKAYVYFAKTSADGADPVTTLLRTGKKKTVEHLRSYQFWFKDMVPGNYLLGAGRLAGEILEWKALEIQEGVVYLEDLTLPALDKEDYLVVDVKGSDGEQVGDVSIRLSFAGGRSRATKRREDGTFWVPLPGPGFMPQVAGSSRATSPDPGSGVSTFTLHVDSIVYGEKSVTVERGTSKVTVRLDEPGELEVVVPGYAGSDLEERFRIRARRESESGGFYELRTIISIQATREKQVFGGVAPGECQVTFEVKNEQGFWAQVALHRVTIRAGTNTVTLPLPTVAAEER